MECCTQLKVQGARNKFILTCIFWFHEPRSLKVKSSCTVKITMQRVATTHPNLTFAIAVLLDTEPWRSVVKSLLSGCDSSCDLFNLPGTDALCATYFEELLRSCSNEELQESLTSKLQCRPDLNDPHQVIRDLTRRIAWNNNTLASSALLLRTTTADRSNLDGLLDRTTQIIDKSHVELLDVTVQDLVAEKFSTLACLQVVGESSELGRLRQDVRTTASLGLVCKYTIVQDVPSSLSLVLIDQNHADQFLFAHAICNCLVLEDAFDQNGCNYNLSHVTISRNGLAEGLYKRYGEHWVLHCQEFSTTAMTTVQMLCHLLRSGAKPHLLTFSRFKDEEYLSSLKNEGVSALSEVLEWHKAYKQGLVKHNTSINSCSPSRLKEWKSDIKTITPIPSIRGTEKGSDKTHDDEIHSILNCIVDDKENQRKSQNDENWDLHSDKHQILTQRERGISIYQLLDRKVETPCPGNEHSNPFCRKGSGIKTIQIANGSKISSPRQATTAGKPQSQILKDKTLNSQQGPLSINLKHIASQGYALTSRAKTMTSRAVSPRDNGKRAEKEGKVTTLTPRIDTFKEILQRARVLDAANTHLATEINKKILEKENNLKPQTKRHKKVKGGFSIDKENQNSTQASHGYGTTAKDKAPEPAFESNNRKKKVANDGTLSSVSNSQAALKLESNKKITTEIASKPGHNYHLGVLYSELHKARTKDRLHHYKSF